MDLTDKPKISIDDLFTLVDKSDNNSGESIDGLRIDRNKKMYLCKKIDYSNSTVLGRCITYGTELTVKFDEIEAVFKSAIREQQNKQ